MLLITGGWALVAPAAFARGRAAALASAGFNRPVPGPMAGLPRTAGSVTTMVGPVQTARPPRVRATRPPSRLCGTNNNIDIINTPGMIRLTESPATSCLSPTPFASFQKQWPHPICCACYSIGSFLMQDVGGGRGPRGVHGEASRGPGHDEGGCQGGPRRPTGG